jgi:Flp pilus assembly protein TadG
MGPRKGRCGSQRGAAIVEFIIALPLLLFLMLATAELGRALFQYNILNKAVQNGARHAAAYALLGSTGTIAITDELITETSNVVVYGNTTGAGAAQLPGLSTADVTVGNAGGNMVSVTTVWTYRPMLTSDLMTFGQTSPVRMTIPLRASVVMRAL